MKLSAKVLLNIFIILLINLTIFSQNLKSDSSNNKKLVYVLDIKEEIGPPVLRSMQNAWKEAYELKADVIILHMNTYGGLVDAADSMRSKILYSKIPVHVFIDNNAASAGALISIACDSIYMRKGANIGATTVVTQDGSAAPDKYQSYMRSTMRSTAEAKGRDPQIAEGMVDPRISIPGVSDSGKVITFTASEAIKHGFCEGYAESIDDVIDNLNIQNYEKKKYTPSTTDRIIGILISPYLSGILIMIIIGGIYFELQSPGIGFPIAAAGIAAILYFAPHYLEGLVENWEIILFIAGVGLMIAEVFVIPGFGIAGILGIICMIAGLAVSMVPNDGFDFSGVPTDDIFKSLLISVISIPIGIGTAIYIGNKIFETNRLNTIFLNETQKSSEGFIASDEKENELVGKLGKSHTVLRPSGKVLIDNEIYDATSEIGYIEKGEEIIIIKYENMQLYVRKTN